MRRDWLLWVTLAALVAGSVLVRLGTPGERVTFRAAMQMWADALQDAQELTVLTATRMTDAEEMALGRELAASLIRSQEAHPEIEAYVRDIAVALLPHVQRKGIEYQVHVVRSPQVNAFALPGGHIVMFTGMLERLETEAEVAMVLGHEIAHVDQYHCAELYQLINFGRRLGARDLGVLTEFLRRMAARGYKQFQESAADVQGFHLAVQAGYDPGAGRTVWNRLSSGQASARRATDRTPVSEAARAVGEALGTYGRSHPGHSERYMQLESLERGAMPPPGKPGFYVGRENHWLRVSRQQKDIPGEWQPKR